MELVHSQTEAERVSNAVADLHAALAGKGQLLKGFRDGDRVRVEFQGVTAYGRVDISGTHNTIGSVWISLDGTGQRVKVSESYVTKEGA